ncbi:uncharacterized protein [Ptychodera flava]|uniref:uncharacterized protein isoform X3 n=1 Tax=Ptychodera flava TaxID=63121 RepID=UPI00396A8ABB
MNEIFKLRLKTRWRKRISTVCYAVGIGVFCWLTIAIHNDNFKFSLGQSVRSFAFNSGDYIHLITATDEGFFAGLPTLINSVQMTSRNPQSVMFHVIVCGDDNIVERLREYLACFGIGTTTDIKVQIVEFNPAADVDEDIMFAWEFMFIAKRLKSDCNYARSYMYSLFPDVKRAIYLDVDTVVKEPIENLWRIGQNYQSPLLASEVNRTYEQDGFFLETVSDLYQKRYGKRFDPSRTVFNGGVLVIDLDFYRKYNLINEVEYWA